MHAPMPINFPAKWQQIFSPDTFFTQSLHTSGCGQPLFTRPGSWAIHVFLTHPSEVNGQGPQPIAADLLMNMQDNLGYMQPHMDQIVLVASA